jgi:hypothetical protein
MVVFTALNDIILLKLFILAFYAIGLAIFVTKHDTNLI